MKSKIALPMFLIFAIVIAALLAGAVTFGLVLTSWLLQFNMNIQAIRGTFAFFMVFILIITTTQG